VLPPPAITPGRKEKPALHRVYAREIGDNPRESKPQDVTVRAGAFTTVDLVIDTGIR